MQTHDWTFCQGPTGSNGSPDWLRDFYYCPSLLTWQYCCLWSNLWPCPVLKQWNCSHNALSQVPAHKLDLAGHMYCQIQQVCPEVAAAIYGYNHSPHVGPHWPSDWLPCHNMAGHGSLEISMVEAGIWVLLYGGVPFFWKVEIHSNLANIQS